MNRHGKGSFGKFLGLLLVTVAVLFAVGQAQAGTAVLTWRAPTINEDGTDLTDLAGYNVHFGTASGVYTNTVDVGNVNRWEARNLTEGTTYFFAVTAYTESRVESAYSLEVSKTIPLPSYPLDTARSGSGSGSLSSSPGGISCGAACSASFPAGTAVTLTASADASSVFTGWSGACSGTGPCIVTMDAPKSVTAAFAIKSFIITASAGAGGSIAPGGPVSVTYGGSRTFTITPSQGFGVATVFVDGNAVGSPISYTFTNVTANHSIEAVFSANAFTVTPAAGPGGSISPSSPRTADGNAVLSFQVTPNSGFTIASVSGCGGSLDGSTYTTAPIIADCTVSAFFTALRPTTLAVEKTGNGTVVSSPAGIDCGAACTADFAPGTTVTLEARPAPGWAFEAWNGTCDGSGTCTIVMDSGRSVTASFTDAQKPLLSISSLPDGSFTSDQDLNVSGTVTDNGTLAGLRVNGTAVPVREDGTFSSLVVLTPGTNRITVTATDAANNRAEATRSITLDRAAPAFVITAPADNSATAHNLLAVSGTMRESGTVSVALNDGTPQLASLSGREFTSTVILRPGQNTIVVTATDIGRYRSASQKRTIVYDDGKPSVSITSPASDSSMGKHDISLQGRVTDSLTVATAEITVDGITTPLPLDVTGAFNTTAAFGAEGLHTITVTATNAAGESSGAQRNIEYIMFGDVNASDTVDLADALLALSHVSGTRLITEPAEFRRCDVAPLGQDGTPRPDGLIDIGDVVVILRRVVGLASW